jgi:hypothetical protein
MGRKREHGRASAHKFEWLLQLLKINKFKEIQKAEQNKKLVQGFLNREGRL